MRLSPGIAVLALALAWSVTMSTSAPAADSSAAPKAPPAATARPQYASLDFRSLNQGAVLLSTPQGLFALREAVVARLDPATLEPKALVQLFGPPPELPKSGPATAEAANEAVYERARRMMPAAMFAHGGSLLILVGDRFFRVDAATLEIKVNVSVAEDESVKGIERLQALMKEKQALAQDGDRLYVLRGKRFFSISGSDGKVAASCALPDPMVRRFYPDSMMFKSRPQR